MQFLYPALTVGFFLVLAPVLIHLINMLRHRRVRWAAMEFLLHSHKKHRKWIQMRQWILLLTRMLLVALIVAMLAQLVTRSRYEGLFGSTLTHHYVLIDDSLSMTDRTGGSSAFDQALRFAAQLAAEASRQDLRQRFTLLRFSRAAEIGTTLTDPEAALPPVADINAEDVDARFSQRLEEVRQTLEPTQLAVGPEPALRVAARLMKQTGAENRVVYVVSDFRAQQWDQPRETRELLSDLEKLDSTIHLVNCVRSHRPNLAITELAPADETRAAGVPLFVNVSVTNFGVETVTNVPLRVRTVFFGSDATPAAGTDRPRGTVEDSPILQLERIEPGQTVTQRVQVYFPEAGIHVVEALLPEDSVAADNRRWCVVDFPAEELVLVVDGDPQQRNAFYLQAIFEPGQRARTGIRPDIRNAAFLRDTSPDALRKYSAIYLLDVDRLDDRAIANLESHVASGGGLALFVGPQVQLGFYNDQLYRGGTGLFPLSLERDDFLDADDVDSAPDLEIQLPEHPVLNELVQGQNPIARMIRVERFLRPALGWFPPEEAATRVLARLRNGSPLIVEKTYGEGRVIAVLTTYAPYWNDLVLGPGVLVALRLQSYLGSHRRVTDAHLVGQQIDVRLDGDQYRQDVRMFLPGDDPALPVIVERSADRQTVNNRSLLLSLTPAETSRSGVAELWTARVDGPIEPVRLAVNVDSRESDLAQTPVRDLVSHLEPVNVAVGYADQYESAWIQQAGFNQSLLLMAIVVVLLVAEQLLAYFTSFHPARTADNSGRGRAGLRNAVQQLRDANRPAVASTATTGPAVSPITREPARGARR